SYITRNSLNVNFGSGASGDATHTQGRSAGTGTVQMNTGSDDNLVNQSLLTTVKYTHRGDVWRIDAGGSFNHANYQTENLENGHVATIDARITNLVVRGEGIGENGATIPTSHSATDRSGNPVDLYDGGNYTLNSIRAGSPDYNTYRSMGNIDLTREFYGNIPVTLKSGLAVDRLERQRYTVDRTWNFRPNGSSAAAARLAGNFDLFDEDYNATAQTFYGQPVRWISKEKVYDLFTEHPDWFEEDAVRTYNNSANNRLRLVETVSAAYLRADVRLLENRLWIVAGARYEHTS